jgi:hypothetical protein
MGNAAGIVEKIIDLLLPVGIRLYGTGQGILVFEEQWNGDSDFKPVFSKEREQPERSSLSRAKARHDDVCIEGYPPLAHSGIVDDTAAVSRERGRAGAAADRLK